MPWLSSQITLYLSHRYGIPGLIYTCRVIRYSTLYRRKPTSRQPHCSENVFSTHEATACIRVYCHPPIQPIRRNNVFVNVFWKQPISAVDVSVIFDISDFSFYRHAWNNMQCHLLLKLCDTYLDQCVNFTFYKVFTSKFYFSSKNLKVITRCSKSDCIT